MNPPPALNRRGFLGTAFAAATAGSVFGPAISGRRAAAAATGETDHFWYRLAPKGPYIDSQRGNKAFGFGDGKVCLSEDNGWSWARSTAFPDAENITFSCVLK